MPAEERLFLFLPLSAVWPSTRKQGLCVDFSGYENCSR